MGGTLSEMHNRWNLSPEVGQRRAHWQAWAIPMALVVATAMLGTSCTGGDESASSTTAETTTSVTFPRDPSLCPEAAWMEPGATPAERSERLIDELTLEQKVAQLHGEVQPDDFRVVPGIPELCVPDLLVTNGPAGVGASVEPLGSLPATALPAPLALAATWQPSMAHDFGDLMGEEMRQTGRNLLEAPDVDLARVPLNGRTFEAFGEDPFLVSEIAVAQIKAVQDHGIIAMAKHYVANNQEEDRFNVDAIVSERALHELYLAPFEATVRDADVASVMCAYNKVNGTFNCENEPLLTGVLRDQWGFEGFVQSDFGATHSTVESVTAGMDLEMPSGEFFGRPLLDAVNAGTVSDAEIDQMLDRRYVQMFRLGIFDRLPETEPIPMEEHGEIAQHIAEAGTVLLRNESDLLPLDDAEIDSIAVVGPWATQAATGGGGSSIVNPMRTITPLDGITTRAGDEVEIIAPTGTDVAAAVTAASEAEVAVVVVGEQLTEGTDRTSLSLPDDQDALIEAVAAANPRTAVVIHGGAPVLMPWLDSVGAVIMGWYPGQEDGTVTAAVLFGDSEPGGRLPITFPAAEADLPTSDPERYPGVEGTVQHHEDLEVGYRHYLANGIEPLFPFGFGLSYTSFDVNELDAPEQADADDSVELTVQVKNTGDRRGTEVVQAYVESPPEVGAPSAQLQGFTKVTLDEGGSKTVTVELAKRAFAHWDADTHDWVITPGTYGVLVGTSSQDTPLTAEIELD